MWANPITEAPCHEKVLRETNAIIDSESERERERKKVDSIFLTGIISVY